MRSFASPRFAFLTLALATATIALVATTRPSPHPVPAVRAARVTTMAIPLLFEPASTGERYVAHGAGYQFAFDRDRIELLARTGTTTARVGLRFLNARSSRPVAESAQTARVNYLIGRDDKEWRTGVPTFGRLRYPAVYDGIDAVFYGTGRQLEYDLVVAPHGDVGQAGIAFDGIDAARLDDTGDLILTVGGREMRQSRPVAYQEIAGQRHAVAARYALDGHTIRFAVGAYDRRAPLVIDPVFIYSTFFGGSHSDGFMDVAVDATGAAYAAGQTFSSDFAGTAQPGTPAQDYFANVVVVKFDRTGRVVYSTIFGGSEGDLARGIAVDLADAAYVVGWTTSLDFPVSTTALQRTRRGNADLFVAKLSPSGTRLSYATYLGGSGDEDFADIAVNSTGQAYVAGTTNSSDLPVTAGALDTTNAAGTFSGFVAKLNASGSALVYGTYLTGESQWANTIALDDHDRAVVGGLIDGSMTTTVTVGPRGGRDAYVMALNDTGTALRYSTRIGGTGSDDGSAIAIGPQNSVVLVGVTNSPDFPSDPYATEGHVLRGSNDAFIAILWSNGNLNSSRYFGGSGTESAYAVSMTDWIVTVLGDTTSADLPTQEALQSTRASVLDAYVARFNTTTRRWSTYLGGSSNDYPRALAVDGAGAITVVGETQSATFPLKNAVDTSGGTSAATEGFISRFAMLPRGTPGAEDVVVHVADVSTLHGNWIKEMDSSAAGGFKLHNIDHGAAKITTAKANPTDYFEFTVDGLVGEYRVWVRGRADNDSYNNDSVYLQFSYADEGHDEGQQLFPIGSTSGMPIVLEACQGCGVHGWGWQDDGYGQWASFRSLNFYSGRQPVTVRVQAREDGISIDQIVFARSAAFGNDPFYFWAPGYQKDDDTIMTANTATRNEEIVLVAGTFNGNGAWRGEADSTADGGFKFRQPDAGLPKLAAPQPNPANYIEKSFDVIAGIPYRLWIRGRADADYWGNDSAYVQFSGSVTATGVPIWRIGSNSATTYVLEDCTGCGVKGWGWNDNGYDGFGQLVYFAESGTQTIRIQTREDGLAIDQVVLSSRKYLNQAPGTTKNDTTLLNPTQE